MLTVCIDSNVYISALVFGGKPYKVVELALDRKFFLVISSAIIIEVKHNLINKLEFTEKETNDLLDEIINISTIYEPNGKTNFINHAKDNLVLETALLGNADILVTGDKRDLLPLKSFNGIIIEPPSTFLDRLEKLEFI